MNANSITLVGDVFTANHNETLTALGLYVLPTPYSTWEEVGLYNSSGTLLESTSINEVNITPVNGYYWQNIPGASLSAGQQYTLVVFSNGSNPAYGTSSTPPTNGWATYDYGVEGTGNSLAFLPSNDKVAGTAFYGANIMASQAPEPESLLLLGSGLVGLAGFLKLKLRKN